MDEFLEPASLDAGSEAATPETSEGSEPRSLRETVESSLSSVFDDKPTNEPAQRQPERGPDGRFAPKQPESDQPIQPQKVAEEAIQKDVQLQPQAQGTEAPSRFTAEAKQAWQQAPEALRNEVIRLEKELTQGIEKYRASAENYEKLRGFDESARESGTTLDQALTAYVGIENILRSNPVEGMLQICRNIGIDPRQMGAALSQIQPDAQSQQPQSQAYQAEIARLRQELGEIRGDLTQIRTAPIQQQINDFAQEAPYFALLENDILAELKEIQKRGSTLNLDALKEAYTAALNKYPPLVAATQRPSLQEQQPAQPQPPAPAQTRKAGISITGTPSSSGSTPRKPFSQSPREAVERSLSQIGL